MNCPVPLSLKYFRSPLLLLDISNILNIKYSVFYYNTLISLQKNEERCKFDVQCQTLQKCDSQINESALIYLSSQLVFFYERGKDRDRLVDIA